MSRQWRTAAVGFLVGAGLLGAVVFVVGGGRVLSVLRSADPVPTAGVLAAAVGWLAAWGLTLHVVLAALDAGPTLRTSLPTYAGIACLNNVTPFGQAGGEPLSALLIARVNRTRYETGLAAVASVDVVNVVPSVGLALAGVAYLGTVTTFGRQLTVVATTVGTLGVAVCVGLAVGWRYRGRVEAGADRLLAATVGRLGGLLPDRLLAGTATPEDRVAGFFGGVERIATTRGTLALALGFSTAGWALRIASLWLALSALGATVPAAVVVVVVPAANVAGVAPLPGGLGSIDATFVGLLVPLAAVGADVALAAVLLHRLAVYWLPVALGGAVVASVGLSGRPRP